jgi:hypothetical protein
MIKIIILHPKTIIAAPDSEVDASCILKVGLKSIFSW